MKKITILWCVLSIFIMGCTKKTDNEKVTLKSTEAVSLTDVTEESTTEKEKTTTEKYINAPDKLSLYIVDDNYIRNKTNGLNTEFIVGKDISSFEVFPSTDNTVPSGNFSEVFTKLWNEYSDNANFKIGYNLYFTTDDGKEFNIQILKPEDIKPEFTGYIEVYIYDDVNVEKGKWYSHLLQEEVTDKTIITSIKLTAGKDAMKVKNMKLSAFIYEINKDFSSEGLYNGDKLVTISVSNVK